MLTMFIGILGNQKGQGMVEYGLILALVSVAALAGLGLLGGGVTTQIGAVTSAL